MERNTNIATKQRSSTPLVGAALAAVGAGSLLILSLLVQGTTPPAGLVPRIAPISPSSVKPGAIVLAVPGDTRTDQGAGSTPLVGSIAAIFSTPTTPTTPVTPAPFEVSFAGSSAGSVAVPELPVIDTAKNGRDLAALRRLLDAKKPDQAQASRDEGNGTDPKKSKKKLKKQHKVHATSSERDDAESDPKVKKPDPQPEHGQDYLHGHGAKTKTKGKKAGRGR